MILILKCTGCKGIRETDDLKDDGKCRSCGGDMKLIEKIGVEGYMTIGPDKDGVMRLIEYGPKIAPKAPGQTVDASTRAKSRKGRGVAPAKAEDGILAGYVDLGEKLKKDIEKLAA